MRGNVGTPYLRFLKACPRNSSLEQPAPSLPPCCGQGRREGERVKPKKELTRMKKTLLIVSLAIVMAIGFWTVTEPLPASAIANCSDLAGRVCIRCKFSGTYPDCNNGELEWGYININGCSFGVCLVACIWPGGAVSYGGFCWEDGISMN